MRCFQRFYNDEVEAMNCLERGTRYTGTLMALGIGMIRAATEMMNLTSNRTQSPSRSPIHATAKRQWHDDDDDSQTATLENGATNSLTIGDWGRNTANATNVQGQEKIIIAVGRVLIVVVIQKCKISLYGLNNIYFISQYTCHMFIHERISLS
jgi:hypothetical protein